MIFVYQLTDNKGKITKGRLEAANIAEARNRLALQDGTIVSLEQFVAKKGSLTLSKQMAIGNMRLLDRIMFAKHLAVMIRSGMSIDAAFEVLADNPSALVASRMKGILEEIRRGHSLADALKKYPKDFDNLFINMVAVGESSGTLSKNLELLAMQQHKTYDLRNKIKAASIYPSVIIVGVVILIAIVSKFVLPRLTGFFSALGTDLPLSTKIMMAVAGFFVNSWGIVVGAIALIFVGIIIMSRYYVTRLWLHYTLLKIPLVGKINSHVNLALFCRTTASLLTSGIPIDQALNIVSNTLTNTVYREQVVIVYHSVLKGNSLADAMANKKYFPTMLHRMTKVGENSGNLSEVLNYLAEFYEEDVDNATKNFSNVLEPALLVAIGLTVGFAAISIIQPIFKLISVTGA